MKKPSTTATRRSGILQDGQLTIGLDLRQRDQTLHEQQETNLPAKQGTLQSCFLSVSADGSQSIFRLSAQKTGAASANPRFAQICIFLDLRRSECSIYVFGWDYMRSRCKLALHVTYAPGSGSPKIMRPDISMIERTF
jgi:hypothetical protein